MQKNIEQNADLSYGEFQLLLREHGLSIADRSALSALSSDLSEVEPKGDLTKLEKRGMLDKEGDWHDALIAICDPDFATSSILAFTGVAATSTHFNNRANSKLIVGCWLLDDKRLRISFPWEPEDIVANSLSALMVDNRASFSSDIREMHFTPQGFAAFAAATDAVRAVLLASTLQRQQISSFKLPREKLNKMLQMSVDDKTVDSRWLVTLFRVLAPAGCMPSNKKVSGKGFQELLEAKLIKIEDDDQFSPAPELMSIAANWLVPLPAIYHEAVTSHLDGSQDVASNIALRGSGPLCLIEFKNISADTPAILLHSLSPDELWLHLTGQLTPPKAEKKPEPGSAINNEPKTAIDACTKCSAQLEPGLKFCTQCGQPVGP